MPKTKTIRGFLIDPENNIAEERTIEKSLDSYYATLRCSCIDIVSRPIFNRNFDIICDDEALLTCDPYPSALSVLHDVALCGPIFVVRFDGKDDVTDLEPGDTEFLSGLVGYYEKGDKLCPILTSLAY